MSYFNITVSVLKFQKGLHCPGLISSPSFTFPLNLRGASGWKNGGGSLKDLTEL